MKLLGSSESKITKYRNGENVPHLEITELVLVHCNLANNYYQQDFTTLATNIWYFIRNFTNKSYLFKNISFRISRNQYMVYRSK